jgi:hypothetical protein
MPSAAHLGAAGPSRNARLPLHICSRCRASAVAYSTCQAAAAKICQQYTAPSERAGCQADYVKYCKANEAGSAAEVCRGFCGYTDATGPELTACLQSLHECDSCEPCP